MNLVDAIPASIRSAVLRQILNLYPPYLGAGVRVERITPDWREVVVTMDLRWYNRNFVGTHFGGSLYTMVDPFFMLMLLHLLGDAYIVWDRSSRIDFEAPGKGRVTATFRIGQDEIDQIHRETAGGDKHLQDFCVQVVDAQGQVVANVVKTLYVRRKKGR